MEGDMIRKFFRLINKYFMVPAYRIGLGPIISNPLAGYIMLLKTVGRKTGIVRHSPVNYAIRDGSVYCLAGWGKKADWYRNLKANPKVELVLPGGVVMGVAEDVETPEERLIVLRKIMINAGFAGYLLGINPRTASDEVLREKSEGLPAVRIRPVGVGSGACDPGGYFWLFVVLVSGLFLLGKSSRDREKD